MTTKTENYLNVQLLGHRSKVSLHVYGYIASVEGHCKGTVKKVHTDAVFEFPKM